MNKEAGQMGNAFFCETGNFTASSLSKALAMCALEFGDLPITTSLQEWDCNETPISYITYKRDESGKVTGLELA